jgi:hypothetical protein
VLQVFSFLCWVSGGCVCFLFYFVSWVAFCVMTHFSFGLICKVLVKVQKLFYYTQVSSIERTLERKHNFLFV